MHKQKQSDSHSQFLYVRNSKSVAECAVVCVKYKRKWGGYWHKALVVGSVSLWRRLLASRL